LEAVVGRGSGTELGGVQRLPLAAGAEDEEDGVHAYPIGRARASAAEAMRIHMLREVHRNFCPEAIRDAPVIGYRMFVHGGTKEVRSWP